MLSFDYLDEAQVIKTGAPGAAECCLTGRGGGSGLKLADTVWSEGGQTRISCRYQS